MNGKSALFGYLLGGLVRTIALTMRWRCEGLNLLNETADQRIFAFWHAEQVLMPYAFRKYMFPRTQRQLVAIASRHSDGQIMAAALRSFQIESVSGSSSRGGAMALRGLLKAIARGSDLGIAPDGPTGPIQKSKPGVVHLAVQGKILIQPLATAVSSGWYLRSWDRMFIPKPFSVGVFVVGPTIKLEEATPEKVALVDAAINVASQRAKELCR